MGGSWPGGGTGARGRLSRIWGGCWRATARRWATWRSSWGGRGCPRRGRARHGRRRRRGGGGARPGGGAGGGGARRPPGGAEAKSAPAAEGVGGGSAEKRVPTDEELIRSLAEAIRRVEGRQVETESRMERIVE